MDEAAMDGGAESAVPPQPQHAAHEEAHVEKPVVLETCDETDRLLAADDSSQEMVPEAADVTMEDGDAPVEKEAVVNGADGSATKVDDEVAVEEEPADLENEKTVDEPEPSTPPKQKHEDLAVETDVDMTTEKKEEKTAKEEEAQEHPALVHERVWYGELPAFVKRGYGLSEDSSESPTGDEFPMCTCCYENGKPRALASVCCQEDNCAFKDTAVCSACFPTLHATAIDRTHRQRFTKACPHCHLNRVSDWCVGCDLSFCTECFAATHDGIKRVANHRKFSLDGTTGDMLIRAQWTPHFREVIMQLQLEQRQQLAAQPQSNGAAASTPTTQPQQSQPGFPTTLKRKRSDEPPEIICIEEDGSDSDKTAAQPNPQPTPQRPSFAVAASMPLASSTRASGYSVPPAHRRSVSSTSSVDFNGISRGTTPVSMSLASSSATSTPVAGMPMNSTAFNQNANAWQIPAVSQSYAAPPTPTQPSTAVAIPSTAGRVPPLDNPIENVMFERMNQLSQRIEQLELEAAAINRQVVQASYHSVVNAHNMMGMLETTQQQLRQLTTKRDVTVVHLVAQSKSIISKVKQLRMDLLGDIPQVHAAGYRRIFQLSSQIVDAEAGLVDMNQRMQTTLEHISVMSSEVFHRAVTSLSTAIQAQQQTIANYKEERENEVVRLVQYHHGIRETLKRAVQQNQMRRQQQSQYIQPTQAPIAPQPVNSQPMASTSYPMVIQPQQVQQSHGLYQQFQQQPQQQQQQHQQHQQPQQQQRQQALAPAPAQLQPLGFNYNDISSQRTSDASVDFPISPPPFP